MRGVPPVPIPNTAVKPSAANGSWTLGPARVGRCQVMARFFERRTGPLFCPDPAVGAAAAGHARKRVDLCLISTRNRAPSARTTEIAAGGFPSAQTLARVYRLLGLQHGSVHPTPAGRRRPGRESRSSRIEAEPLNPRRIRPPGAMNTAPAFSTRDIFATKPSAGARSLTEV